MNLWYVMRQLSAGRYIRYHAVQLVLKYLGAEGLPETATATATRAGTATATATAAATTTTTETATATATIAAGTTTEHVSNRTMKKRKRNKEARAFRKFMKKQNFLSS
jgi:carbohydrate-binding DOMON domain-containing protein